MNTLIDFSGTKVSEEVIDQFVYQGNANIGHYLLGGIPFRWLTDTVAAHLPKLPEPVEDAGDAYILALFL